MRGGRLSWNVSRTRVMSKSGCLTPMRTKTGVKGSQGRRQLAVRGRIWRLDASQRLDYNIRALKSE